MCQRKFAEMSSRNYLKKRNLTAIPLILIPEQGQLNATLVHTTDRYFPCSSVCTLMSAMGCFSPEVIRISTPLKGRVTWPSMNTPCLPSNSTQAAGQSSNTNMMRGLVSKEAVVLQRSGVERNVWFYQQI